MPHEYRIALHFPHVSYEQAETLVGNGLHTDDHPDVAAMYDYLDSLQGCGIADDYWLSETRRAPSGGVLLIWTVSAGDGVSCECDSDAVRSYGPAAMCKACRAR